MTTIDGIPVYRVLVDDERDGMVRVSLVDDPAVMSDFEFFDRQERPVCFSVADEEKRIVRGVVARADFPIIRSNERLGDHYVIFPADTIREMAEKYLTEGRQDRVDEMHTRVDQEGIHLVQWFIKDTAAGINPAGYENIADGSLFAEYHVLNDMAWQAIKDGTFKGFSMEVFFSVRPEEDVDYVEQAVADTDGMFERIVSALTKKRNMNKKNLLRKLGRMLAEFASITTDKGILAWDGDEDLKAGDRVYIEDAEGNRSDAADGDYMTEDGKTIVVVEGAVAEIRDPEAEVAPEAEEPAAEEAAALASVETDNGVLYWDGEEDLKEGDAVYVQNEDGERSAAPDGDYKTADGKVIKVAEGVVASIEDAEAEVADEPAPAEEELRAENDNLKAEIEALRKENEELKEKVETLSRQPLAKPAHEVVNDSNVITKTGVRGKDRLAKYFSK